MLNCSLPMNAGNTELVVGHASSASEELAKKLPTARIVSAFSSPPSEVLFGVFERRGEPTRPSMVYCGDDARAKAVAARLIQDAGFDSVDAGPLRLARCIEPFTLLIAELAYGDPKGPELAYRFEWF